MLGSSSCLAVSIERSRVSSKGTVAFVIRALLHTFGSMLVVGSRARPQLNARIVIAAVNAAIRKAIGPSRMRRSDAIRVRDL
jgi:hypothetical protein